MIVIVLGGSFPLVASVSDLIGLPLAALLGGLLTAVIVYGLSWRRGIEGYRLVLVGVGIGAVAEALTSWMLVYADITDAARATVWLTGSLNARGWEHVVPVATRWPSWCRSGCCSAFGLGALQLGDDTARGLGVRVDRARSALLLTAVGLAAVATASAGPIAFVALVVPQVCLRLVGSARPPLRRVDGLRGAAPAHLGRHRPHRAPRRAAGRDHHRDPRRPVPDLAARAGQWAGSHLTPSSSGRGSPPACA